jgi:phosphopantothenoylcysteine decarboxylase/phosphopantothenate--cysteine ligase
MDGEMYDHPATQANVEILRQRGAIIVGPAEGRLASGLVGVGRMVEPAEILGHIRLALARSGPAEGRPLLGRKVVVTAGGTQEPIDPVRSITNRSSGKQGFALAQAALDLGAEVTLIAGVTTLPTPIGALRIEVQTAKDILEAVLAETTQADILLMAAAVADFRPASPSGQKIKKESGVPELRLEATPDVLRTVAKARSETGYPRLTVGFAAESQSLVENARLKLASKKLDLLVANDISTPEAGFGVDTNEVTLVYSDGRTETLPLMSKTEVAEAVLQRVVGLNK